LCNKNNKYYAFSLSKSRFFRQIDAAKATKVAKKEDSRDQESVLAEA
jgi:hypothetical protein